MKKLGVILLVFIIVLIAVFQLFLKPNLQVVNGYAAKNMCSCVFVAGHEEAVVKDVDLGFSFIGKADVDVDYQTKSTSSTVFGLVERKAVYRPGLGCVLINEIDEETLRSQSFTPTLTRVDSLVNWFELADTVDLLSDSQANALEQILGSAFENDTEQTINSRGMVVLHKGQLIGEKYADGYDENSRLLGWSMTKSITSTMAGLMIRDGYFKLDDKAPVLSWTGTDKESITYRDLLQMSSGLKFKEDYGSYSDANIMLWISDSSGIATIPVELEAPPGEKWSYSSGTTNLLMMLMRSYFSNQNEYLDYLNKKLFNKIGAYSMLIEPDGSGSFVGSSFGWGTARDWARIGQLYLNEGKWGNEQVLAKEWVSFVQMPPADPKARTTYGGQFWLNGVHPDLPEDSYFMTGFHGQRVMIIPSKDLVVVRLGVTYNGQFDFDGLVNKVIEVIEE